MDRTAFISAFTSLAPVGQQQWTSPGTYSFVVPGGVFSISAVVVGGGQSGGRSSGAEVGLGGQGADLRYASSIPVTPGETLTVDVGTGGVSTTAISGPVNGTSSRVSRAATVLLVAKGGGSGTSSAIGSGLGGGAGGAGGTTVQGSGGGGAGGYAGAGGAGTGANGTGGAGGGGAGSDSRGAGGGGGVGLLGQGSDGTGGVAASGTGGAGGSGGATGITGSSLTAAAGGAGGAVGAGGGGARNGTAPGGRGADGGVRIIYPANFRSYPSNMTQDV